MVDNLDQPDPFDTKNNIIFKCCNFFLSVVSHDMAASAHESNFFFFFLYRRNKGVCPEISVSFFINITRI